MLQVSPLGRWGSTDQLQSYLQMKWPWGAPQSNESHPLHTAPKLWLGANHHGTNKAEVTIPVHKVLFTWPFTYATKLLSFPHSPGPPPGWLPLPELVLFYHNYTPYYCLFPYLGGRGPRASRWLPIFIPISNVSSSMKAPPAFSCTQPPKHCLLPPLSHHCNQHGPLCPTALQ